MNNSVSQPKLQSTIESVIIYQQSSDLVISHFRACPFPPKQAFVRHLSSCWSHAVGNLSENLCLGVGHLSMFITIPPCISLGLTSFQDLNNIPVNVSNCYDKHTMTSRTVVSSTYFVLRCQFLNSQVIYQDSKECQLFLVLRCLYQRGVRIGRFDCIWEC